MHISLSKEEQKLAREWRKNKLKKLENKINDGGKLTPIERSWLKMWRFKIGK